MLGRMLQFLVRRGLKSAVQTTTGAALRATSDSFRQVFHLIPPATVYVRASHCILTVRRQRGELVELHANLQASFGWEFVADQDAAGVYIVAKRKPVIGALSHASFTLIAPPDVNLVLHVTPGTIHFEDVDGKITLPAAEQLA